MTWASRTGSSNRTNSRRIGDVSIGRETKMIPWCVSLGFPLRLWGVYLGAPCGNVSGPRSGQVRNCEQPILPLEYIVARDGNVGWK